MIKNAKELKELIESGKILVKEIMDCGFTCDTMASERLYRFYKACQNSGNNYIANLGRTIEKFDNKGAGRTKAMTYALLVIGSELGQEYQIINELEITLNNFVDKKQSNESKEEPLSENEYIENLMVDTPDTESELAVTKSELAVTKNSVKVVTKPEPMRAIQYTPFNITEVIAFIGPTHCNIIDQKVHILSESNMDDTLVSFNDWIVKDSNFISGFSIYSPESFKNKFDII